MYIPSKVGRACADELRFVPWGSLKHAYGVGKCGEDLDFDVDGSLRALAGAANEEALAEAAHALWSNTCHQGTIYEATAHTVPFLAALAAGENEDGERLLIMITLLLDIALASTIETLNGSRSGAFGDGVAANTREALRLSDPALEIVANRIPRYAPIVRAISAYAARPTATEADRETLRDLLDTLVA